METITVRTWEVLSYFFVPASPPADVAPCAVGFAPPGASTPFVSGIFSEHPVKDRTPEIAIIKTKRMPSFLSAIMVSFKVGKVCLAEEKDAGDVDCKIEIDDIRISDVIKRFS